MSCRGLIAAVATVAAILSGGAGAGLAPAQSRQEPDLAAYNLGVAAAVRSDLAASVRLPDGGQVYVFGDTLAVNGQVICGSSRCPHGYPHDSIAIQRLNAWNVTGPWHVATQQWQAKPAPGCAWTYSAETHPASPAPPGTMLVSWASNHDDPGMTCDMQPQFTDLPIGSPPCASPPHDPGVVREQPCLGPVGAVELDEHARHVSLDRGLRQVQSARYLGIR
jgi:hypothetical protein